MQSAFGFANADCIDVERSDFCPVSEFDVSDLASLPTTRAGASFVSGSAANSLAPPMPRLPSPGNEEGIDCTGTPFSCASLVSFSRTLVGLRLSQRMKVPRGRSVSAARKESLDLEISMPCLCRRVTRSATPCGFWPGTR